MPHIHNGLHHFAAVQAAYRKAVGEPDASFNGIERAGETLYPVLDLWRYPEFAYLRRERHYANFVNTSTAPAGRFACVELVNPAGSGLLAVVRACQQASSPDFDFGIETGAELSANRVTASPRPLDTRLFNATTILPSSMRLTHGDVAAAFGTQAAWHADTIDQPNFPAFFVLAPGTKLFAIADTANTDIQVNLWWSERAALPGELE